MANTFGRVESSTCSPDWQVKIVTTVEDWLIMGNLVRYRIQGIGVKKTSQSLIIFTEIHLHKFDGNFRHQQSNITWKKVRSLKKINLKKVFVLLSHEKQLFYH